MEDFLNQCIPLMDAKMAVINAYIQGFVEACNSVGGEFAVYDSIEGKIPSCEITQENLNDTGKNLGPDGVTSK